jgi:hypothetical protein
MVFRPEPRESGLRGAVLTIFEGMLVKVIDEHDVAVHIAD